MDTVSINIRRRIMQRVPRFDSAPERKVRRLLHRMGFRFRLHRRDLPGRPDIVISKHRIAVFVHGCFWHQHEACSKSRPPTSNIEYWSQKFYENKQRDERNETQLERLYWKVLVLWECEVDDPKTVAKKIKHLIDSAASAG